MAKPQPVRSETGELIRFVLKLLLAVLILRSFIVAPYSIPSESMLPRLYVGDFLLVTKFNYGFSRWSLPWGLPLIPTRVGWATPRRGDVVVFRSPDPAPGDTAPAHAPHDVIKRVIGVGGDTIQVRHGQVILNGRAIPQERVADLTIPVSASHRCEPAYRDTDAGRPICRYRRYRETLPDGRSHTVLDLGYFPDRDDTDLYAVPAGTVFLMGDNRDNSADSRFPAPDGMGYIPIDRVEGRALVTFFSTDGSVVWWRPSTWVTAARPARIGDGF